MSIEVHLVRHGETVWHAENRYAGSSDVALTHRGREQAERLAGWATGAGLIRIVSSDLSRARETAEAVARRTGVSVDVDPRLREVDFGEAEGMTSTEMERAFPEARRAFEAAPASSPLPGGEPGAAAAARMMRGLADLAIGGGPVLVVAHTTVIRLALCRLLGLPLDAYRDRFPTLGNASVTTVRLPEGDPAGRSALLRFNMPLS